PDTSTRPGPERTTSATGSAPEPGEGRTQRSTPATVSTRWGNTSPTHSSALRKPSAARRAVFNACRDSSGCCRMSTRVRLGNEGICAQRQWEVGRRQRSHRARRGRPAAASCSLAALALIGALRGLLFLMRLSFQNQRLELGRRLERQHRLFGVLGALLEMQFDVLALEGLGIRLNLNVLLQQTVYRLLRFVQLNRG